MSYDTNVSKFMAYHLRHDPKAVDTQGWSTISYIIGISKTPITRQQILDAIEHNEKKRFILHQDGERLRARQGHSVPVDVGLQEVVPPTTLFHGTASRYVESIYEEGMKSIAPNNKNTTERRPRLHVHLSENEFTARTVGARHGSPVVLVVEAKAMYDAGHKFWVSENGVYLTEYVPPGYIQ